MQQHYKRNVQYIKKIQKKLSESLKNIFNRKHAAVEDYRHKKHWQQNNFISADSGRELSSKLLASHGRTCTLYIFPPFLHAPLRTCLFPASPRPPPCPASGAPASTSARRQSRDGSSDVTPPPSWRQHFWAGKFCRSNGGVGRWWWSFAAPALFHL